MFDYLHPAASIGTRKNAVSPSRECPICGSSFRHFKRDVQTFIPRMSLDSKGLYILPILFFMNRPRPIPLSAKCLHLTLLPLIATLMKLEVELLRRCGIMARSEQRSLIGREVLGDRSRSVTAQARKEPLAASSPIDPPKNTRPVSLVWGVENQVSMGEPFWWDPASKRKTWLPRSVYEWAC
jgi:hypothetical protein